MVEWPDLATVRDGIKTATDLASLAKLLDGLRKKMASKGGDTRERLDALIGVVRDILDLMGKSNQDTARSLNGVLDVMGGFNYRALDIMKALNHRIGVLERAAKKKPRKPARRKPVKRKRRT